MAWHTPKTWTPGEVVSAANLNEQLRDNMNHLLVRPLAQFQSIDGVQWQFTNKTPTYVPVAPSSDLAITPMSGRVLLGCHLQASATVSTHIALRVNIDAGASYVWLSEFIYIPASIHTPLPLVPVPVTVSAGVQHTFRLEIGISGVDATVTIYNLNNGRRFRFWALEI